MKKSNRFMSNIDNKYKNAILQAAKDTGFNIQIDNNATDKEEYPLPNLFAVYTNEPQRDHTEFWIRYKELKNEA